MPSEQSSREWTNRGGITKTGNVHARRLLTEVAWNYHFKARIGWWVEQRQQEPQEHTRSMGWNAQLRSTRRFAALYKRCVQRNNVCVAIR